MVPGSPKLPTLARCMSLAAKWGKNKDVEIIISGSRVSILWFIRFDIN